MKVLAIIFASILGAFAGLTVLLNAVDASVGISLASLIVASAIGGVTIGYFSDRLPDFSRSRRMQ